MPEQAVNSAACHLACRELLPELPIHKFLILTRVSLLVLAQSTWPTLLPQQARILAPKSGTTLLPANEYSTRAYGGKRLEARRLDVGLRTPHAALRHSTTSEQRHSTLRSCTNRVCHPFPAGKQASTPSGSHKIYRKVVIVRRAVGKL